MPEHVRQSLSEEAARHGVAFVNVTFSAILEALRQECADYERDLLAIVDDYETYLSEEHLLDERNRWLLVFPCGTSVTENANYALYYEPQDRRLASNCRYLGVYTRKAVSYVGVIKTIVVRTPGEKGKPRFLEEVGRLSEDQKARIAKVVEVTDYYDLDSGPLRFYLPTK